VKKSSRRCWSGRTGRNIAGIARNRSGIATESPESHQGKAPRDECAEIIKDRFLPIPRDPVAIPRDPGDLQQLLSTATLLYSNQ
jgi:hypothetical protein